MGAGQTKPKEYKCKFGNVFHHKEKKSTLTLYGEENSYRASVKITAPGARVKLIGEHSHTTCTMKIGAHITTAGIVEMTMDEALVVMKADAKIVVEVNARLEIAGTLLMDQGSSLIIEPGARLSIDGTLHIAKGATVRVAYGVTHEHFDAVRVSVPNYIVDKPFSSITQGPQKDVTWCDEDKALLVGLIRFFCHEMDFDPCLILPVIMPLICRRYGVITIRSLMYDLPRDSENLVRRKKW